MPHIKQTLKKHLHRITIELGKLPELPHNVELVVQSSVMEFGELARSELRPAEFSKRFGSLPDDFRNCLIEMKPKFTLTDRTDTPIVEISDEDSDTGSTHTVTPTSKRRTMAPPTTPAKRQRLGLATGASPFDGQSANGSNDGRNGSIKAEDRRGSLTPRPLPAPRALFPEPFSQFSKVGRGFRTLRGVSEEIRAKTRAGMPDIITEEVYNDLCREAMQPWDGPTSAFLKQIMRLLQDMLDAALRKSFDRLSKRLIYQESRKLLKEYLEERRHETQAALDIVYRLERYGLFTINREAFDRCRKDEAIVLNRFRHHMRMRAAGYSDGKQPIPWEALNDEKRSLDERRRENELSKIGPDPFQREMEVVSYVRGYYRLAALRFADAVALHITNGMLPEIQRQLPHYLDERLGLRGNDAASIYEKLMEEDTQTATKRETLKGEREKFVKALASIEGLETGGTHEQSYSQLSVTEEVEDPDAMMSGALQDDVSEA